MAKYRVERNCFGFKNRYWCAGEEVELSEKDKPPRHFKRLDPLPEPTPDNAAEDKDGSGPTPEEVSGSEDDTPPEHNKPSGHKKKK